MQAIKPITWEYIVHCEDQQGKPLLLKGIGDFSTPHKAKTYVSRNGKQWMPFGDFEVYEKGKTAQSSILEILNTRRSK